MWRPATKREMIEAWWKYLWKRNHQQRERMMTQEELSEIIKIIIKNQIALAVADILVNLDARYVVRPDLPKEGDNDE